MSLLECHNVVMFNALLAGHFNNIQRFFCQTEISPLSFTDLNHTDAKHQTKLND